MRHCIIKEYYEDGTLKAEKDFKDGKFDVASVKYYNKDLSPKDTVIVKEHIVNDKVAVGVTVLGANIASGPLPP